MNVAETFSITSLFYGAHCKFFSCYDRTRMLMQASGEKVEVVGTTHATTGVRRLVKSVVRGLKACQVRFTVVFSTVVDCTLPATVLLALPPPDKPSHVCVSIRW